MLKHLNRTFILCLVATIVTPVYAQTLHRDVNWSIDAEKTPPSDDYMVLNKPFWCNDCKEMTEGNIALPLISNLIKLKPGEIATSVSLKTISSRQAEINYVIPVLNKNFQSSVHTIYIKGIPYAAVTVNPVRKIGRSIELLTSYDVNLVTEQSTLALLNNRKKKDQTYSSILATGDIFKISVPSNGVFKIDRAFLLEHGISSNGRKLSEFKIYGNGGDMLPEVIAEARPEDLLENALWVHDENSNDIFDDADYVLWYAQGPDGLTYDVPNDDYIYDQNVYGEKSFYFIKWSDGAGKRMSQKPSGSGSSVDLSLDNYDYFIHKEDDEANKVSFIHSGRMWWGYEMNYTPSKTFIFDVPGAVLGDNYRFKAVTCARSINSGSNTKVNFTGGGNITIGYSSVTGAFDGAYATGPIMTNYSNSLTSTKLEVNFQYSKPNQDAAAWIYYFDVVIPRQLKIFNGQQSFFNHSSTINGNVKYIVKDGVSSGFEVLDVTDPTNSSLQQTFSEGSDDAFIVSSNDQTLRKYLFVNPNSAFKPQFEEKIENQNYHGIKDIDYLIVSYKSFMNEAERLANFHRDRNNLVVEVVDVEKIYNEFSSGSEDVTAIRDFVKLLYDRGNQGGTPLKYLLLFGDASYDYKNRIPENTNYVPIYESFNSYNPASSHCSDDYYAILDDNEGKWGGPNPQFEGLDIGVGRLPVASTSEAKLIVDKILWYHSENSLGNWTQKLTLLGDDEDNNQHLGPTDSMVDDVIYPDYPIYNVNKIYLDAYEQVSFGSGNKYPEVNLDVDKAINQGTLIFNYMGHGGNNGMAHERVVTRPQIVNWNNYDQLTFCITASCELAEFDNPIQKSPGELMLFDPNGGAIGMVATTRVVYIGDNSELNFTIIDNNILNKGENGLKPLGDVYMDSRNASSSGSFINKRSFMLFADPAMGLLGAPNKVVTTKINGKNFAGFSDTLKALSIVTIEGEIWDDNNVLLTDFNGTLFPTIYDKFSNYKTRGNDPSSKVVTFKMQNNVIYKGKITVEQGKFKFSFVVPKDIAYYVDFGKLSYYAYEGLVQAGGNDNVLIGGSSDSLIEDTEPPKLELYIDDRSWTFLGTTGITPLLLADVFDENGLNTVGNGIGREMEAVLDAGTEYEQKFILNEFFEPSANSYQSGVIQYTFPDLAEGKHTLSLKVWDVFNNPSEAYTEFIVAGDQEFAIDNLLNYPNPFNKLTTFHFDHNKAGQNLVANLIIYTISGQVVKSVTQNIPNAASHSADIIWNGRDDFNDPIARGVYLYTLEVKAEDGSTQKKTEKLYIIN